MSKDPRKEIKLCKTCQRPFHNRKKWESRGLWENILYCSDACRNKKKTKL